MAAVGHLWFFLSSHLLRNYLTDSNETCLLCSPQCIVVRVQKKKIRSVDDSRLGLSEISHGQACCRISSKTNGRIFFRSWSECSPQCLVVQVQNQNPICRKTWPLSANFEFSCYRISSNSYWVDSNETCLLSSLQWLSQSDESVTRVKNSHLFVTHVENSNEFVTGVTNTCEFFTLIKLDIWEKLVLITCKISKLVVRIFYTYQNVTYSCE